MDGATGLAEALWHPTEEWGVDHPPQWCLTRSTVGFRELSTTRKNSKGEMKRLFLPRQALAFLVAFGSVILTSCGATTGSASSTAFHSSDPRDPLGGKLPSDIRLFTVNGTWVAPRDGTYTVVAVGAGGGGGGAGSASTIGGISDQVGGSGGAAGAVTINDVIARTGEHFAIEVGVPGTPGSGGAVNGGSGERGGTGGSSSCAGIAFADGGVGGDGSPGNSNATVLNPLGAGNSSDGTLRAPGSGGGAEVSGGEMSGSSYLYAWPGGGGGGAASATRGGSGGGAAGVSGADSPGGGLGDMPGANGGDGATNRIYTSGAGGGGGGGGAPGGRGGIGGRGQSGAVVITGPLR
jgi:hypothetical protein